MLFPGEKERFREFVAAVLSKTVAANLGVQNATEADTTTTDFNKCAFILDIFPCELFKNFRLLLTPVIAALLVHLAKAFIHFRWSSQAISLSRINAASRMTHSPEVPWPIPFRKSSPKCKSRTRTWSRQEPRFQCFPLRSGVPHLDGGRTGSHGALALQQTDHVMF